MESYLFIPGNNPRFLSKIQTLKPDYFVVDLEDSIADGEIDAAIKNIIPLAGRNDVYVRIPFKKDAPAEQFHALTPLLEAGFTKYVIPKIEGREHLALPVDYLQAGIARRNVALDIIALVENPVALMNLKDICSHSNVRAVGFGSHDYCAAMGMEHTSHNLYYARQTVLNIAKAWGRTPLDIVSVNLNDDDGFCREVMEGFSMGFEGKFLIHPKQLELLKGLRFYSAAEVEEAKRVSSHIMDVVSGKKALVEVNGKVYEKPHVSRILKILNWSTQRDS